jgi:hypothetical protein
MKLKDDKKGMWSGKIPTGGYILGDLSDTALNIPVR